MTDRERGSGAVELAMLMPIVLFLTFAGVQYATYFMARAVALAAAQEATTAARALNAPCSVGQPAGEAFIASSGDWLRESSVAVECSGDEVTTTVTGVSLSIIPGLNWRVSQTARGEVERFTT